MNITVNLARARSARERYRLAWVIPVLVVGAVVLVKFVASARSDYREHQAVHAALARELSVDGQLRGRENALRRELDEPRYRNVLRQVQFVNGLIDQKQLSLTEVTSKVTKLLPPQARLSALAFGEGAGEPIVRFGVEAQNEGQAETFLSNLEESPDFRDVTVTAQSFVIKPGEPITVSCTARYAPELGR